MTEPFDAMIRLPDGRLMLIDNKVYPKHTVNIQYHMDTENFSVSCSVCGRLGTAYSTWSRAMNRKSTHDREQDTGSEHGR